MQQQSSQQQQQQSSPPSPQQQQMLPQQQQSTGVVAQSVNTTNKISDNSQNMSAIGEFLLDLVIP